MNGRLGTEFLPRRQARVRSAEWRPQMTGHRFSHRPRRRRVATV